MNMIFLIAAIVFAAVGFAHSQGLEKIWEMEYEYQPYAAIVDEEAGVVYLASNDGVIFQVDITDGKKLMSFQQGYCPSLSRELYILKEHNIIVGRCLGGLTTWDIETGEIIQTRELEGNERTMRWAHTDQNYIYVRIMEYDGNKETYLIHRWDPLTGEDEKLETLTIPEELGQRPVYPMMSNITSTGDFVLYTKSELASNYNIEGLFLMNVSDLSKRDTLFSRWQEKELGEKSNALMPNHIGISEDSRYLSLATTKSIIGSDLKFGTVYFYDILSKEFVFEKQNTEPNEAVFILNDGRAVNFCGSSQWPAVRIYSFPDGEELYYSGGLKWSPDFVNKNYLVSSYIKSASLYRYTNTDIDELPEEPNTRLLNDGSSLVLTALDNLSDVLISEINGKIIYQSSELHAGENIPLSYYELNDKLIISYTIKGVRYAEKKIY
jgi:hypothetical protein